MPVNILTLLTTTIGVSVGRFLLKQYLGDAPDALADGLSARWRRGESPNLRTIRNQAIRENDTGST